MQTQLRQHHVVTERSETLAHRSAGRLGVEHCRHAWLDRTEAFARRINTDRAAMRGNVAGVEYFEPVHDEQMSKTANGVVPQVLVIDGVVLQVVEQADQVMRFRNEYAVRR